MQECAENYIKKLQQVLSVLDVETVAKLGAALKCAWETGKHVYICGNGGSSANAMHLVNDYVCGIEPTKSNGIKATSLSANISVLTSLANDISYDDIFSSQLSTLASKEDILLVLSGSGNSPNVVKAIEMANKIGMESFAILGYSGGKCKEICTHPIHIEIDDMQISEDMQVIIGHILMKYLYKSS